MGTVSASGDQKYQALLGYKIWKVERNKSHTIEKYLFLSEIEKLLKIQLVIYIIN